MKKLYVLAALLMATTAAHAGNSISFEIEGHRIHIEAPRNCDSLSCLQISAPGLSGSGFGFKNKSDRDDDVVAERSDPPAAKPAPAPAVQAAVPQAPAGARSGAAQGRRCAGGPASGSGPNRRAGAAGRCCRAG